MPAVYVEKYLLDYESAPRFILLSLICLFCSLAFLRAKRQWSNFIFLRAPYFILAAIFLALAGIQALRALNPGEAAREWIRFALFFFLVLILSYFIMRRPEFRNHIMGGIITAAMIFIVLAFWEQRTSMLNLLREGTALKLGKYDASTLVNKNFFAETLTLSFPFALAGSFHYRGWMRYTSVVCSALCLLMLILLQFVSAWIALACSSASVILLFAATNQKVLYFFRGRPVRKLSVLLIALVAVLTVIFIKYKSPRALTSKLLLVKEYYEHPPDIVSESEQNKNSIFERYLLLRNTWLLIEDHWLLGVGLNNWKIFFPQYGISGTDFINQGNIHYDHPHNDFLFIWSELGLTGLIIYLMLFIIPLKKLIAGMRNPDAGNTSISVIAATFFSLVSFLILSLSEFPRLRMYSMIITAAGCAVAVSLVPKKKNDLPAEKGFNPSLLFLFMILVSATGIYAGMMKFKGEYHMKKELLYRTSRKYSLAEKESRLARSFFFTADLTGTPLYWYTGVDNFYDENPEGAMYYLKLAEQEYPYHNLILKDLGTLYSASGDYETALAYYNRALEVRPLLYDALVNKSAVFYNMRNIDSAFATIQKISDPSYRQNKRYKETLDEILYTKAYLISEKLPEEERKRFLEKIENPSWLIKCYEPTLSDNSPFDSTLIHNFQSNK